MSEVKRILKSIGAAILVMVAGAALLGGGIYGLHRLSETQCVIFIFSALALFLLGLLSCAFYMDFGPKPPAPPEPK